MCLALQLVQHAHVSDMKALGYLSLEVLLVFLLLVTVAGKQSD